MELGRAQGITQEQIETLAGEGWRESALFSEKEKAAIRWAEAVTNLTAREDDAAFRAMERHFPTEQLVSLTIICGLWNLTGRVAEALHLVVEPPGERIAFQDGEE